STPKPEWVRGSNDYFGFMRHVEQKDEAVVIRDTFKNLTAENLPLMHRHEIAWKSGERGVWLAGLKQTAGGATAAPENPTTYAAGKACGVGLIALDDLFRVHVSNYAAGEIVGLADNSLVLKPGAVYTTEWAIVPTEKADYFEFLNAARRLVDANFNIDGGFAFLRATPQTDAWSDAQIADFLRFK